MTSGRAQLAAWLDRSKLKQYELSELLRVKESTLSKIMNGHRVPTLPIAVRIQELTGIPESSWVDTRRGRSAQTRSRATDKPQLDTELTRV